MKKTALFSDTIFIFIAVSLPLLCFLRYFRYSMLVSVLVSVLIGGAICALFLAITNKKTGKTELKKREEKEMEELLFALGLMPKKRLAELFLAAFLKTDDKAILKRYASVYAIQSGEWISFPLFPLSAVTVDDVANVCKIKTSKRKKILVGKATDQARLLCKKMGIPLLCDAEIYKFFKETEVKVPSVDTPNPLDKKQRRKHTILLKRNAKQFCYGGIILLITSLFTPFRYYYLIIGCAMMICALLLRIFGHEESVQG